MSWKKSYFWWSQLMLIDEVSKEVVQNAKFNKLNPNVYSLENFYLKKWRCW